MPKDIVPSNNSPVLAPRLPGWLEEICDDSHPDIPWKAPERLPTQGDLQSGIAAMERLISDRATPAYAKQCLAQLMVAFEPNTKLSADEVRLRAMVWLEANGDLCDGLWREATQESIRTLKWMPKPAEFRGFVEGRVIAARKHLRRLREMLEAHARPREKPFVRESADVRIRGMRDTFRRLGKTLKAAGYETQLAEMEGREPEEWARNVAVERTPDRPEQPPFVPSNSPQAKRLAEMADEWRRGQLGK